MIKLRLLLALLILPLAEGCATAPGAGITLVETPVPCKSAQTIPEQPQEHVVLDATPDGAVLFAMNRSEWIGYGKTLREKLEACK